MRAVSAQQSHWSRFLGRSCGRTRRWYVWLRRDAGRHALFVILMLSLIEPFGCLVHCRFVSQTEASAGQSAGHAHHHGMAHTAGASVVVAAHTAVHYARVTVAPAAPLDSAGAKGVAPDMSEPVCTVLTGQKDPLVPPLGDISQSLHEHLALLPALVTLLLATFVRRVPNPLNIALSTRSYRLLRPPILLAA